MERDFGELRRTKRKPQKDHQHSQGESYRVCQGLWPSLMFGKEDIEPQNFWASSKSHVATTYLCMHFCINYICWSNQVKYYETEMHCAKQDVATLLYDEANIFSVRYFHLKAQANWLSRLATQVTIFDTHVRALNLVARLKLTTKSIVFLACMF